MKAIIGTALVLFLLLIPTSVAARPAVTILPPFQPFSNLKTVNISNIDGYTRFTYYRINQTAQMSVLSGCNYNVYSYSCYYGNSSLTIGTVLNLTSNVTTNIVFTGWIKNWNISVVRHLNYSNVTTRFIKIGGGGAIGVGVKIAGCGVLRSSNNSCAVTSGLLTNGTGRAINFHQGFCPYPYPLTCSVRLTKAGARIPFSLSINNITLKKGIRIFLLVTFEALGGFELSRFQKYGIHNEHFGNNTYAIAAEKATVHLQSISY